MFYDRLLKISSLKIRLLASTSFAPLHSFQKLPLAKLRREGLTLTPLIAGLLAACGGSTKYVPVGDVVLVPSGDGSGDGSDGGSGGPFAASDFTVHVTDGTIEGAQVFIDNDGDGVLGLGDVDLGVTDATGVVLVDGIYAGEEITVSLTGAVDLFTAEYFTQGVYTLTSDPRGEDIVISPITFLVDQLMANDPALSTQDAIDILFGEDSGIDYDDINDPDNYFPSASPITGQGRGHPITKLETISQTGIDLQVLLEQNDFAIEPVLDALLDENGFSRTDDLTAASLLEASERLTEARERSGGEPVALPQTGLQTNEDVDLALGADVWGFRDPVGNVTNAASALIEVRIVAITDAQIIVINDSGVEEVKAAGSTITEAELANVVLRPDANYFGSVTITYRVFDGESVSDVYQLEIAVVSVNDLPTDIELSGDRDDLPGKDNEQYVLFNGKVLTADGSEAGLLTTADVETNNDDATGDQSGFTYALSGANGDLFEIINGQLQLRAEATLLPAGSVYSVIVTVTDDDGGSYSEAFEIIQGGLYVNVSGVRTYSNGAGLIDEATDGSASVITLGGLGVEGLPADAQNDSSTLDTVIYHTNGTVNDTSDDWVLMVLEDFASNLSTGQFDIV